MRVCAAGVRSGGVRIRAILYTGGVYCRSMDCGPLVLCVEWLLLFGLCVCVLVRGVVPWVAPSPSLLPKFPERDPGPHEQ